MTNKKHSPSLCTKAIATLLLSSGLTGVTARLAMAADPADCARIAAGLGDAVANVACIASPDLTTANPHTTPQDNSIPGLPTGAFTPTADALNTPSALAAGRYPISKAVPGLQIAGTMSNDSGARWVLRLPDQWNGRLMIAVAPGVSSEYSADIMQSDYLVQNGYAFASNNKGHLNKRPSTADDPLACPSSPPGGPGANTFFRLYQADLPPRIAFAIWVSNTIETTRLAKRAVIARYGQHPAFTYVGGKSAGGLVARRVLETDPSEFDGGIEWAAPYIAALGNPRQTPVPLFNNLVGAFAIAMTHLAGYRASGYDPRSPELEGIMGAGLPPDMFGSSTANSNAGSYLESQANLAWMSLECGNVRASDPDYAGDIAEYRYWERVHRQQTAEALAAIGTTGNLKRPLISVHGTMDATAPILGSRLYRGDVIAQGRMALHRLYEIQNGTHRDSWKDAPANFTAVEYMLPHFTEAFESLVRWIENAQAPPPSQCVGSGAHLVYSPSTVHCSNLLVP